MLRHAEYTEAMRDEWDQLALSRGTVFHTIAFSQILTASFGYQCAYHAVLKSDGRICALIPLIVGRNLGLKKAGVALPFVNYMDICAANDEALRFALASVPELLGKLGLDYIELRLKEQDMPDSGWSLQLENCTFVIPLSDDEEKVLALSAASNRNHVRKVYKNHWFTVSFDPCHLEAFYQVYVKRMKELGSPAPDIRFFKHFFEYLPDNSFLLTVLENGTGKIVGGMLLVTSPSNKTVYYPYGANLIEYNSKYLNNYMYWEAVKFAIKSKMEYLDLGRSQIGSGTYKYKEQWGAKALQLKYLVYNEGRQGASPPDRERFSFFIELWKVTPSFVTNSLGKQIIKYLMP